jgi:hypothetical protein
VWRMLRAQMPRALAAFSGASLLAAAGNLTLVHSTYIGGAKVDDCDALAVGPSGDRYLGCHSDSIDLPGAPSTYTVRGDLDAFVIRTDAVGSHILYRSQIGGSAWEAVQGVTVDKAGHAYVIGTTHSSDLPTTPRARQQSFGGGKTDAFLAKLDTDGRILWCTYLGGAAEDDGRRVAIDPRGRIAVVGRTESLDFPITSGALQRQHAGSMDSFIATFDSNGRLLSSTYFGGTGGDVAMALALSPAGEIILAGNTTSTDFPIKGGISTAGRGDGDAYVAKLDAQAAQLIFSTLIAGAGYDLASGVALDRAGIVYVGGATRSIDFPVTSGAYQRIHGGGVEDGFVLALSSDARRLQYATYFGGDGLDSVVQLAVDPGGNAYIVGGTESKNFPQIGSGPTPLKGTKDVFVGTVDPNGTVRYSMQLGGSRREALEDLALTPSGAFVAVGLTESADFPVHRPLQPSFAGGIYDIVLLTFLPDATRVRSPAPE